jgi:hypothetical protein
LVCVAPRSEPRLAPFAREPLLGLFRGVEANNMLLLPAKSVCRHEAHANPSLIGLGSNVTLSAGFAMLGNMSRLGVAPFD